MLNQKLNIKMENDKSKFKKEFKKRLVVWFLRELDEMANIFCFRYSYLKR